MQFTVSEQWGRADIPAIKSEIRQLKRSRQRVPFRTWCLRTFPWAASVVNEPLVFPLVVAAVLFFTLGGGFALISLFGRTQAGGLSPVWVIAGSLLILIPVIIYTWYRVWAYQEEAGMNAAIDLRVREMASRLYSLVEGISRERWQEQQAKKNAKERRQSARDRPSAPSKVVQPTPMPLRKLLAALGAVAAIVLVCGGGVAVWNMGGDSAVAHYNRGNAYADKKEYDKAIEDYSEAIRLDPKYAAAYTNRGTTWQDKKEYDKAVADYDRAILIDPKYALAFYDRGNAYYTTKEYDKAIEDYSEAIRLDPKDADAYVNRGVAYFDKEEYDKAIEDYSEAIRLDPNNRLQAPPLDDPKNAALFTRRGTAYANKKEYDKAVADYDRAILIDPKYALAFYDRGNAYYTTKEYDKAIEDYSEAIRLDPKLADAYVNRGVAYVDKKEYDKAIEDYSEAIRLDPKYAADAYTNRGTAYAKKKEYDKAIEDYSEAIRLDPKYAAAYTNRGLTYVDKKEYDKAIEDYSEAIRLDPKDARPCGCLAWLLATCPKDSVRDGNKAVEYATKACELSEWKNANKSAFLLDILAAAQAETGNFEEAVKWQNKVIELGYDDKEKTEKARQRLKLYEEGKPYRDE